METGITLLAVSGAVLAGSALSWRLGLPAPLVPIVIGILGSYLPFVPEIRLSPEVVLLGILPPLLYAAAIQTSLVDFARHRAVILGLSVGLVLFTATGVGLVVWWLLPVPFAVAFALGAVVAPPDAVAATAVGRAIGLPRGVVSVLEGESLVNDATALVSLRTTIAAAGLAVGATHEMSMGTVALDFLWASLGGVAVGLVVATVVEAIRRRTSEPTFDTVLSFMAPFAAYLPAEAAHASGVIAVVTAGLLLGHRSPRSQAGPSRLSERVNWASIQFLLENSVFLLIGLQVFYVFDRVGASSLGAGRIVLAALATLAAVLLLRPLWVFPFRWFTTRVLRREAAWPWTHSAVLSWAGMRGVVTLAAAFLLPEGTPQREVLILIAVTVTVGTLLLQGTTLPRLARRLGVRGPDPREDALQAAAVMQAATRAGLEHLEGMDDVDAVTRELLRQRAIDRTNQLWERVGPAAPAVATPGDRYRRARLELLAVERAEVLQLRDAGRADHEVLRVVLAGLDVEETMLQRVDEQVEEIREEDVILPEHLTDPCPHLADAPTCLAARTPQGCAECLRDGTEWVHLRLCLTCGHVGCCDSSVGRHASGHWRETGHPVMRSIEPGEAWRWCYVDEVTA